MKKLKLTIQNQSPKRLKSSFVSQLAGPQTTKQEKAFVFKQSLRTPKHRGKRELKNPGSSKNQASLRPVPVLPLSRVRGKGSEHSTGRHHRKKVQNEPGHKDLNSSLPVSSRKPESSRHKSSTTRIQTQLLLKRNSLITSHPSADKVNFPITPSVALQVFAKDLTSYEQAEILNYPKIWFLGLGAQKQKPKASAKNYGFDDERADYKIIEGDHIAYRYEILGMLGSGSFGKVLKVLDHKDKKELALKIIRNKSRFHTQAEVEIKVLKYLKDKDTDEAFSVIHILDDFAFRNHVCLTFELLSHNLFDFLQKNDFQGLSMKLIRRFSSQLLQALQAQEQFGIIHCDLKPENILLCQPNQSVIKVIDYGSSCFSNEKIYTYIQSRFYRAPEIMLGIEYTTKIDMWSFGCILAELHTGTPLFPGECEAEQLCCIMEVLGPPPSALLKRSTRKNMFFDGENPILYTNSRGKTRLPLSKNLGTLLKGADNDFVSLVRACLEWDPQLRISAKDALSHTWIQGNRTSSLQPHQGHKRRSSDDGPTVKVRKPRSFLNKYAKS